MSDTVNYTKEAFLGTGNLVFMMVVSVLAVGAVLAPVGPSWLPEVLLAVAVGGEGLYLGTVSTHPRFRRSVRARVEAERRASSSQGERYRRLSRRSQRRYYRLREFKNGIRDHYRQLNYASQGLLDDHLDKIDGLLQSYLELLRKREQYRVIADRSAEEQIQTTIQELEAEMADDADRVRAVKKRRLNVLEKRLSRCRTARENLEIVGAQLGTIEDVMKYIHEQSWTLQDPDDVTMQLDALLEEVEETQRSIHDVEHLLAGTGASVDDELRKLDAELEAATEEPIDASGDATGRQSRVRE